MAVATRALFTGAFLVAQPALSYPPTGASWTRSPNNPILSAAVAWEQTAVVEPEVMVEGGLFKMWYRGGWDNPAIGYATCPTSADCALPGNWTKYAGNPIYGKGGSDQADEAGLPWVVKAGSTYYLSAIKHVSGVQAGMVFATSADGLAWTTVAGSITLPSGTTLWGNRAIWYDDGWKMLAEAGASPWQIYRFTSSDGLAWTQVGSALTTLQIAASGAYGGPTFLTSGTRLVPRRDGLYHLWYHAAPGSGNLPTNIHHATSPDLATWTKTGMVLEHTGTGDEVDQVADARVITNGATAYLFYATGDNVAEEGTIAVATAPAVS